MGYQWRNGRLISDEEKAIEDKNNADLIVLLLPLIVPTIGLAALGYTLGGKWLMLLLGIAGGFLSVKFYWFFFEVMMFIAKLLFGAIVLLFLGVLIWIFLKI